MSQEHPPTPASPPASPSYLIGVGKAPGMTSTPPPPFLKETPPNLLTRCLTLAAFSLVTAPF